MVRRDERKLRDALVAFAAAVRAYDKRGGQTGDKTGGDEAVARHYYGMAKVAPITDIESLTGLD